MDITNQYDDCQTDFSQCPAITPKASKPRRIVKTQQRRTLILPYPDGLIEVYGEPGVSVFIANVPYVSYAKNEPLAMDCMEEMIPRRFREIYWPCNLLARAMPTEANAEALCWLEGNKQLYDTLNRINERFAPKPQGHKSPIDPAMQEAIDHAIEHRRKQRRGES